MATMFLWLFICFAGFYYELPTIYFLVGIIVLLLGIMADASTLAFKDED